MKQLTSFWNLCSSVMNLWYSFSFPLFPEGFVNTPQLLFNLLCLQQSYGSGVLADGRLADLIRRVATFGMVLMKLDLRQVWFIFHIYHAWVINYVLKLAVFQESGRHADTLDAITTYLDMGTYSEWDEEKKLDFLTRELKGKRPLVPVSIEVRQLRVFTFYTIYRVLTSYITAVVIFLIEGWNRRFVIYL